MDASLVSSFSWWWLASFALIAVGVAGTVLPMLPGTALVLAGILLGAWIDGFAKVSGWTLGVIGVLALLAWATDYVAAMLGARKAGASRLALVGAAVGTVLGVLTGFVGLLFMPLLGAMAGEYWSQRQRPGFGALTSDHAAAGQQAAKVGVATWIGLLLGTVVKLVLVFLMIGLFAAAYWV
jgi:uncharacterized protein YqgC (DUF456 family)